MTLVRILMVACMSVAMGNVGFAQEAKKDLLACYFQKVSTSIAALNSDTALITCISSYVVKKDFPSALLEGGVLGWDADDVLSPHIDPIGGEWENPIIHQN